MGDRSLIVTTVWGVRTAAQVWVHGNKRTQALHALSHDSLSDMGLVLTSDAAPSLAAPIAFNVAFAPIGMVFSVYDDSQRATDV